MRVPLYQAIAAQFARYHSNCLVTGREHIRDDASEKIIDLVKEHMPSGSGIDTGTELDFGASKPDRLVFTFGFHHMNDVGMYDAWTDHRLTVTPSLQWGIDTRITGPDRNSIKDYLYDVFGHALKALVEDGTSLIRREDEAVAHLRAVVPHVIESDAGLALNDARIFLNRIAGDYSK